MNRLTKLAAAAIGVISAMGMVSGAMAQKVAFYDHDKVVRDSKAWKAVQAELTTRRDEIAAQLRPVVQEIGQEGEAIQQLVSGMEPADAQKKHGQRISAWQQKRQQVAAAQERANQELSIVVELAETKINSVMAGVFDDIASAKKVDIVTRQLPLGYYSSKYDVTSDVLAAVDRQLATLSVDSLVAEVQAQQAAQQQAAAN